MTQKQMGEILSCSQRVYSNYERGELEILIKLADFHQVSVDYILGRTDKEKLNQQFGQKQQSFKDAVFYFNRCLYSIIKLLLEEAVDGLSVV